MLPPSPGVLIYGGRQYAVGLLWFTVQDEEAAKVLLGGRLKSTTADFYCNRIHISQQQGFGRLAQGHKRGMPVAAAMVADQLVGEWHGVFEADNGWWYVQVRSDSIMPHGDRFFVSEEEAYNTFQEEMTKHNWPHAYAPAKWRLSDGVARELSLKTLLGDFESAALMPAHMTARFGGTKQRNIVFMALGAVMLIMAGMVMKTAFVEPEQAMPLPSQMVARPVLKAAEEADAIIDPRQLINACSTTASMLAVPLPGWKADKFTCTPGSALFSWISMGNGTLDGAKKYGFAKWPSATGVTVNNNALTAALSSEKLPTIQPGKLPQQAEALLVLERDLKPMGALTVKPVASIVTPAPISIDPNVPPPPPLPPQKPYLEIELASGFDPERLGGYLVDKVGLEIQQIDWEIAAGVWKYKMKWVNAMPQASDAMKDALAKAAEARRQQMLAGAGGAPATVPAVPGVATPATPAAPGTPVPAAVAPNAAAKPPVPVPSAMPAAMPPPVAAPSTSPSMSVTTTDGPATALPQSPTAAEIKPKIELKPIDPKPRLEGVPAPVTVPAVIRNPAAQTEGTNP
jgi:hypothetical protein